jgi:hypothetical protein
MDFRVTVQLVGGKSARDQAHIVHRSWHQDGVSDIDA